MSKPIDEQSIPELANTCKLRACILESAAKDYSRFVNRATAQSVCHAMRELATAMARLDYVQKNPSGPQRHA
jgi:hypothetical protein